VVWVTSGLWNAIRRKERAEYKERRKNERKTQRRKENEDQNLEAFGIKGERKRERRFQGRKEGRDSWSFGDRIEARNLVGNQQGIKRKPIALIFLGKSSTLNEGWILISTPSSSNGVIITDNTLFHDKIRQMTT
jgi:hypothetical protein